MSIKHFIKICPAVLKFNSVDGLNWSSLRAIFFFKHYAKMLKKPTITGTVRLHRLHRFGHVQRMEECRIPKRVLCMNFDTTSLRGRPRNRWQDEVRERWKNNWWRKVAGKSL
jgi:hypothetical protein